MKKFLLSLSILLLPGIAPAQETYSVTISLASKVAQLDIGRQLANQAVCSRFSLLASCTQAQACAASFTATGQPASGASCTIVEANNAGVRIYPNSQNGREAFITLEMVKANLDIYVRQRAKLDFAAMQEFCRTANQTQVDGVCTATGLSAGCGVCDSWK